MSSLRDRAERRFDLLRRQAAEAADSVEANAPAPPGWCISTIARLVSNDEGPIPAIQDLQSRLTTVGELYAYPRESLHLSLLGCTQREPVRPSDHGQRLDDIVHALGRACAGVGPVPVELGGLNLVGTQFFIEVFTDRPAWRDLRERLAAEVAGLGENPLRYADFEPMQLNISRIVELTRPEEVRRLLTHDRPTFNTALDLTTLELVITDFVVTPATLTIAHTRSLRR